MSACMSTSVKWNEATKTVFITGTSTLINHKKRTFKVTILPEKTERLITIEYNAGTSSISF